MCALPTTGHCDNCNGVLQCCLDPQQTFGSQENATSDCDFCTGCLGRDQFKPQRPEQLRKGIAKKRECMLNSQIRSMLRHSYCVLQVSRDSKHVESPNWPRPGEDLNPALAVLARIGGDAGRAG